jgi:hypothetical protein
VGYALSLLSLFKLTASNGEDHTEKLHKASSSEKHGYIQFIDQKS